MLDVTIQAPPSPETAAPGTQTQHLSLLDAALRLAAVMRYSNLSFAATADRLERYDRQSYPITYVMASVHVIEFLRALDATRQAREDGLPQLEAEVPSSRPSYGPSLRESG